VDLYADQTTSTSVYYDDFTLARPVALSCSANGPYEGIVGEEIQFEGTASGGTPPYDFLWDFGDGTTSTEEDPIHIYTDAGEFPVLLTVTDADQTEVTDTTTATIIGVPELEIKRVEGGLLKITANVKNVGSKDADNVQWSINLNGGLILLGRESSGTINIAEGSTETITTGTIFGIGSATAVVSVEVPESSDTSEHDCFVLLFFINVKPGGG
jgi:PKD repeat protein